MSLTNYCWLLGHLGNDPEVRFLPDGTPSITFNLATTNKWKTRDGEKKEQTTWHRCVKIGAGADKLAGYLSKGSKILVAGEISNRSWESDGQKHHVTEIKIKELEFLSSKKNREQGEDGGYGPDPLNEPMPDDDVPF